MLNPDPYSGEIPPETRLARLEQKIERLFALLFVYLKGDKAPDLTTDEAFRELFPGKPEPRTGKEKEREITPLPGVRQFHVEVNDQGEFQFQPSEQWKYPVGSRVQWVSSTGSFTVKVDPRYSRELGSPFEGKQEIYSKRDPERGIWTTDVLDVRSLFSPTERMARRLAGAPAVYHTFTIAVSKGDQVFINQERNGAGC